MKTPFSLPDEASGRNVVQIVFVQCRLSPYFLSLFHFFFWRGGSVLKVFFTYLVSSTEGAHS